MSDRVPPLDKICFISKIRGRNAEGVNPLFQRNLHKTGAHSVQLSNADVNAKLIRLVASEL